MLYGIYSFLSADMNSKKDKKIKKEKRKNEKKKNYIIYYSLERGKRQIFFLITF